MSHQDVWQELYRRFDPMEPATISAWRARRLHGAVERIVRKLELPFADPRILLTGTVGTGKSTELLRLHEERTGKELVLLLDLNRQFSSVMGDGEAIQRVDAWEVVFLVGVAVLAVAQGLLPYPVPKDYVDDLRKAWEQVAHATDTPSATDIDLGKMASGMLTAGAVLVPMLALSAPAALGVAAGVGLAKAAAEGVRRVLPVGRSKRTLPDQDEAMQTLLSAVNVIVGYVQKQHRPLLLLIDGLDRIRDEDQALELFLRSELLGQIACRTVVTAPFALRSAPAAAAIPRFETVVLANEPVLDRVHPESPGSGVAFFVDMFRRRTQDMGASDVIEPKLLEHLAYLSGGRARDFVKLVRSVAERAWPADVATATAEHVADAVDEARRALERGLDVGQIGVLMAAMNDSSRRLPEDPRARKLLDWGHLLPYPNESEWYHPHPLLKLNLLKEPGSSV